MKVYIALLVASFAAGFFIGDANAVTRAFDFSDPSIVVTP